MRVVVNTISTKKHSGGALQIAYNFLLESLKYQEDDIEWYYFTSEDVNDLFSDEFTKLKESHYFVFPTQPDFRKTYYKVKKELAQLEVKISPDVIYTISSPCYFHFKAPEVMRFANAWVTNPNKESWSVLSWKDWIRMKLYRINQIRLLRDASFIITQSETVKRGLLKITNLPEDNISVVPNVLPGVFSKAAINRIEDEEWIDVNCAAAPVPHKNLNIIPDVIQVLYSHYGIKNIRFNLTIPEGNGILHSIIEDCKRLGFIHNIKNHGRCTQQQLIDLYNKCSLCFIPSLLETFSASSLEAMYFGQCIVATDYSFNREVIGSAGLYFVPRDANDAARCLNLVINDSELQSVLHDNMKKQLSKYNDYSRHFEAILGFLREVTERKIKK